MQSNYDREEEDAVERRQSNHGETGVENSLLTFYESVNYLTPKKPEERCFWLKLFIIFLLLDLLLAAVILIFQYGMDRERHVSHCKTRKLSRFCLPCDYVTNAETRSNIYGMGVRRENGENVCCVRTKDLENILAQFATEKYRRDRALGKLTSVNDDQPKPQYIGVPASAHMLLYVGSLPGSENVLKQNEVVDGSRFQGNITYKDGCIVVKEPGYYYVYSQVAFLNSPKDGYNTNFGFSHSIFRKTRTVKEILLTNIKSECRTLSKSGHRSNNVGAVFKMEEDDHLCVNVSDMHSVTRRRYENYFGAYMV